MREQDGTQTKQRRNRKVNTANQQNGKQASAVQCPANDDAEAWQAYWKQQGQTWRTEPEIDPERQKYLTERRVITPDIKQGIYPFKDIKLSRADVEWLLATHENGRGPVYWSDEGQRKRKGLDLRGTDLRQINLQNLPLARLSGGLTLTEWFDATQEQRNQASIHLEGADLRNADLDGADLRDANLDSANLIRARSSEADFSGANMKKANLNLAHMEHTMFNKANLEKAELSSTNLSRSDLNSASLKSIRSWDANLREAELNRADLENAYLFQANLKNAYITMANLKRAVLSKANLEGAKFNESHLERIILNESHLEGADLSGAHLENANLSEAYLEGANLSSAHFEQADLKAAHLEGALLSETHLEGANLCEAFFNNRTQLINIALGDKRFGFASLADIRWGETNLAVVNWSSVQKLGDESDARQSEKDNGWTRDKHERLRIYRRAVRANRQLAVVLRNQGLNEDAAHFAYRAQQLQRKLLWLQVGQWKWIEHVANWILKARVWKRLIVLWHHFQSSSIWRQVAKVEQWIHQLGLRIQKVFAVLFSFFLDMLAGYGYRPGRSVICYLLVIVGFTGAYSAFGHLSLFPDALVFSLMSFHGRGFFPNLSGETNLHNPLVVLAAFEAVVGLLIEISFIATFTQRFFGK